MKMTEIQHDTNQMFAGFDPAKHVRNNDQCARQCHAFRLGLAHAYGENRQVVLLSGFTLVAQGPRHVPHAKVFREFKSGAGIMGPPQIAQGIVDMIEDLAVSAGLGPRAILQKLTAYGDRNAEGIGTLGLYNRRIEEALAALGYELSIKAPVDVAGARPEGEALINALVLTGGFSANSKCHLLVDALTYHQCGEVSPTVNSLRYSLFDVLSAPARQPPSLWRG